MLTCKIGNTHHMPKISFQLNEYQNLPSVLLQQQRNYRQKMIPTTKEPRQTAKFTR